MSDADEAQAESTWTTLQTPATPCTPTKLTQEDSHALRDSVDRDSVDRDPVGKTTAVALMDRYDVGDTTMLPSGLSVEDPVVLFGGLEGKTDSTPCSSDIVSLGDLEGKTNRTPRKADVVMTRNLGENTPLIPGSMIEKDLKDPRISSSPTTSTPGNTPIGSGTSELKESELQNSEESAIEISGILIEEKKKNEMDDSVILKMIDISLAGYSEDENESYEADDTSWEATDEDLTLQESGAKSCIARRTRSHKDLRKINLTQLTKDWSTTAMDDSFVFLGNNAIDSLDLPRPEKTGVTWDNKEEWCGKLKLLDTSLDKASKTGGPQKQMEMIRICNRKAAEIARKNEELRLKKGGVVDSSNKEGESKRVTFVVEDAAYTTAIQEVVRALETLLNMNLYTAPLRNVENIIKIILSICLDYSNQVQMVQETMESMARLIRELLILKGKMVNLEAENAKLEVEKEAALVKVHDLTKLNEIINSFSQSVVGGCRGRDFVAEITSYKSQISGLKETARLREQTYSKAFERKDSYKAQVKELNKTIINMEKGRKEEKERELSVAQVRDAQIEELTTRYEYEQEKIHNLEANMEKLKLTHKAEMEACVERQSILSESVNGDRVRAETKVLDLEEELRRVRQDLYAKLRTKDDDMTRKDAKIKEGKDSLAQKEKLNSGLRDMLEIQKQDLNKTKKELKTFKLQCRLFGSEDPNTLLNPIQTERKSKTSEGKDDGVGSELNSTSEASYVDLHSSTAGNWGDTSNMDVTCGQYNTTTESQASKQKGEKRKRMEIRGAKSTEKEDEVERSEISSEESSTSYISEDDKEPSKKKKQGRNKSSKKNAIQKDLSKLMNELKVEHQKQLVEQKKRYQEELDSVKKELEQKSCQEIDALKRDLSVRDVRQPREVEEAAGGVQDPQVSSQRPRENIDPPNQNRQEGSPLIVAVTEENKDKVSNQFRGLIVNRDGTITMTPQFFTWSNNQEIQLQKLFKVAPPHPAEVDNEGHPKPTRRNIVWTHDGEWVEVPLSRHDKGPIFKETLVARVERSIDIDGNIKKALSYGDDETKLKVWFDLGEMLEAFPHWKIPSPSIFFNTRKFNTSIKKPKEAGKSFKGKGKYQGPKNKGNFGNQYKGRHETYQEWDRQQDGGDGAQRISYEQMSWNQHQQVMHQQQQQQQYQHQAPLPPPAQYPNPNNQQHHYQQQTPAITSAPPNQQHYHYPAPVPAQNQQQYYNTAPTPAPGPPTQHQYHHPTPAPSDHQQYQHTSVTEGGAKPKEHQSRDQSWNQQAEGSQQSQSRAPRDSPREYPRERRSSRDRHRRDSRDRDSRRHPSQESEHREPQQEYHTKEYEKRRREDSQGRRSRDVSSHRHRNTSKDRQGDRRSRNRSISTSTRRRSDRTPSPTNSGIGRGGGRRDRDQGTRYEEGRGRGRGNQDRRESDASYGES